jgi:radical SAM protein with 4Fe4S-binding SPASM domain
MNHNIKFRYNNGKHSIKIFKSVELEIHSSCNRDCEFCPRYYNRTGIRKDEDGNMVRKQMSTEKVKAVIDELIAFGFRGKIRFHRLSEPLVDKRYLDFVKYAKSKSLLVTDHTNGDALKNNPELCKQLDGLVDEYKIGLYDYTTHKGKQKEIAFWKTQFKKTKITFSLPLEHTNIRQDSKAYFKKYKNPKILDQACDTRLDALLVRYDGEVSLCCQDDECTFGLGNVFEKPIAEIWGSEKHKNIIDSVTKPGGRHNFKLCSKCYIFSGFQDEALSFRKRIFRKAKYILMKTNEAAWKKGLINIKLKNTINTQAEKIF